MKNMNKMRFRVPMDLQFFAEPGDGAGAGAGDTGNGEGAGGGTGGTDGGAGDGAKSFDDLLKDTKYQSEFDKKIAKALETAKSKWEVDANQKIEDAKTEAQKLAKMNADQKAEYEANKRLAEIEGREKEITTRELKAQAYESLAEKGLPKDLINILNYENAESCNKSIESVEKAFQTAVERAVNERLRGSGAPGASGNNQDGKPDYSKMSDEEYYKTIMKK